MIEAAGDDDADPTPSRWPPDRRRHRTRTSWRGNWPALALLLVLFSCAQASSSVGDLTAATVTPRVRIYMIAPGDDGHAGRKVGCGDSLLPVEVNLPLPRPALQGALEALLAHQQRNDLKSGLYNPLYASRLEIEGIDRAGAQALVRLKGYLELGGECDDPRILAQLQETALQFPDVEHVTFYLGGQPLAKVLGGKG